MERQPTTKLLIGDWLVDPASNEISRTGQTARLEVRAMRLLLCLADHAGEVVSIEDLLNHAWSGVIVSSDSVYQAVTSLRRQLGDDAKQPTYIETVPRLGYRMVAKVRPLTEATDAPGASQSSTHVERARSPVDAAAPAASRARAGLAVAIAAAVCIGLVAISLLHAGNGSVAASPQNVATQQPEKSIAVVPFLDLTEGMVEETFADGMTEELIDKLSKVHELMVPSATASFYYKGRKIPVADLAKSLGVIYLLDGSVRKSGSRVRVAARLIRADNGYVMWTETYDRAFDDILMVQDDIANKVTAALEKQNL
ncbi:MAG TPA: winged helix-turn-helix domain-containing protein [Candidatus Acidoferrum sp.]|jgi:TolB-like protein/DNA-binding winged helix-turn-helix (wHTH) protein